MKRAIIHEYGNFDSIAIEDAPIPEPGEGEILVQMKCAPINVSDLMSAEGDYYPAGTPERLGLEGSGVVVKGVESLIGKRVSLVAATKGTYSEYVVVPAATVFVLKEETTIEQGASLIVNPMTVAYMIEKIEKGNHRAVVLNAAASALGRMLIKWCTSIGVPTVSLVRRQEQVDILQAIGDTFIFNTSEEGWKERAKAKCEEIGVSVGFDAISGTMVGDMIDLVANKGTVFNYGVLSGQIYTISAMSMWTTQKKLEGLHLSCFFSEMTPETAGQIGDKVQDFINNICKTEYSEEYTLDQLPAALKSYQQKKTNSKPLIRLSQ